MPVQGGGDQLEVSFAGRDLGGPDEPRCLGARAHNVWGDVEGFAFVQPGEEKAKGRSCCCLQIPNGRAQRRQRQAILRGAQ